MQATNKRNSVDQRSRDAHAGTVSPCPLRQRWDKNTGGVQDQFLDFEAFKAFEEASAKGLVTITGPAGRAYRGE